MKKYTPGNHRDVITPACFSIFNILFIIVISALMLFCFSGCKAKYRTSEQKSAVQKRIRLHNLEVVQSDGYPINYGDVVEVKFLYHSTLSDRMRVRPDGCISLPYLQDVKVVGKTPSQLRKELIDAYSHELKNPDITVVVREFSGRQIYVGGDVKNPQMINMNTPMTTLQAIIMAGDVLPTAVTSNVLVLRADKPGDSPELLELDLDDVRNGEGIDILLQPNDVIYVPRSFIADLGDFVELYINRIVPRNMSFTFFYRLRPATNY